MPRLKTLLADGFIGATAGAVATWATKPIQRRLYALTPASARAQERRLRARPPHVLAAQRLSRLAGRPWNTNGHSRLADAIHYGTGMAWGALYGFLRRRSGMRPLGAGIVIGTAMSLIIDEALTPALGLSAPDAAYPAATHARGLATHLGYGLVLAGTAEGLYRLLPGIDRPQVRTAQ